AEGEQLCDLVAGNLADGGLVDEGGVHVVGVQLGHGQHPGAVHDDGVALRVAGAGGVAGDGGVKLLVGAVPRHRPGDDVGAGAFAVQGDVVAADGDLAAVGHQTFPHHQACAGGQVGHRLAVGGVDALDLHHLHLHRAALVQVDLGDRVQDPHPEAVALAGV